MPDARVPRNIFFALVAAAIVQSIYDFPRMPDRVASHFGASGFPTSWMAKSSFFLMYAILIIVAAYVEFRAYRSIAKTSPARINLPNKDYWLAPERRAETFDFFKAFFAWYGCSLLLLEVVTMELVIRANTHTPVMLSTGPMLTIVSAFVLFTFGGIVHMLWRFSKAPS